MQNLTITKEMNKIINEKEDKVTKLNTLCKQLVALELKEANTRVRIINKIEAQAKAEGKKVTDKTKQAEADAQLKSEIGKIAHLKNDISSLKREIDLCDDKLSLHRNIIREMELTL